MPPFMISFTLEEVAYVTVNCSSCGDPIEAWCFPFLQLVNGSFDFRKTDGIVNHLHARFLSEEVDRSQTIQLAKKFN
jgi:hypothetical protein